MTVDPIRNEETIFHAARALEELLNCGQIAALGHLDELQRDRAHVRFGNDIEQRRPQLRNLFRVGVAWPAAVAGEKPAAVVTFPVRVFGVPRHGSINPFLPFGDRALTLNLRLGGKQMRDRI